VSVSRAALLAGALCALAGGCEREARPLVALPETATVRPVPTANAPLLRPSAENLSATIENNAYSLAEGKRLFGWYNCTGCHAQGGGDKGPALMDDVWIYGSEPAAIYTTIVDGRPNGMPAFGARIPEREVWEIVGYVRAMAGLGGQDAAPLRDDALHGKPSESRADAQTPKGAVAAEAPSARP
jgi:cytochrome c oxidase cbb3-type subunit 3